MSWALEIGIARNCEKVNTAAEPQPPNVRWKRERGLAASVALMKIKKCELYLRRNCVRGVVLEAQQNVQIRKGCIISANFH